MSKDMLSMTPPLTPSEGDKENEAELDYMDFFNTQNELEADKKDESLEMEAAVESKDIKPLMFDCEGETRPQEVLGRASYLGSSALYNLLYYGNPLKDRPATELLYSTNFLHEELSRCFMIIRKNIQILERESKSFCVDRGGLRKCRKMPFELRKEVVDTLYALSSLLSDLCQGTESEFFSTVGAELAELLKFLGPIHLLQTHVTNASSPQGNKCTFAAFHLLHLHLDVRWWILTLLHQMEWILGSEIKPPSSHRLSSNANFVSEMHSGTQSDKNGSNYGLYESSLKVVVWDIITLMERQTSKGSIAELPNLPSFRCTCCYELAVSVLHLSRWRQKYQDKEAFWSQINKRLLILLKMKKDSPTSSSSQSRTVTGLTFPPKSFHKIKNYQIWLFLTTTAKLFQYDAEGFRSSFGENLIASETKMLRTLILVTIVNCETEPVSSGPGASTPSEEELRLYLRCCHELLCLWMNNKESRQSDWVIALWDHFAKFLDSSFMLRLDSLEGFANMSKTPSGICEEIASLKDRSLKNTESSWIIFLRILVDLINWNGNEWKYLKGRIYSKFHSKKMTELTPIGLYHTTQLFLALADSTDLVTVCTKLCDLLCEPQLPSVNRLHSSILGLASSIFLLISHKCPVDDVAQKINEKIQAIYQMYCSSTQKRDIGHSIILYCEGLQEIFEIDSDLTLGQNKLFCPSLCSFLAKGSIAEQKAVLNTVNTALKKVLDASSQLHHLASGAGLSVYESIWNNFHTTIKALVLSQTPMSKLGSVCSLFVICAARFSFRSTTNPALQQAQYLLNYILDNKAIKNRVTLMFLTELFRLAVDDDADLLSKRIVDFDEKIVTCLLSNLIEFGASDEVMSASEGVFRSPWCRDLLLDAPPCPFGAFEMLVQSMMNKFSHVECLQTRRKIRSKAAAYLSPLTKALTPLMARSPAPNHLSEILRLIGCIVGKTPLLVYIKGDPNSLLPRLISTVILPTSVYKMENHLAPQLSDALFHILPKVVSGLSSLGFASDPYVSRVLKAVFANYMHRFPFLSHPFIGVLNNEETVNIMELRALFVSSVSINFVAMRSCNPAYLQIVISLLLELLTQNSHTWLGVVCDGVFNALLELLMSAEEPHTKRIATELLKKLLNEVENQTAARDSVVCSLKAFSMCQLPKYSMRVFRVLELVAVIKPTVMRGAVTAAVAEAVVSTERKRGSGIDQNLRRGYKSLLHRLNLEPDNFSVMQ